MVDVLQAIFDIAGHLWQVKDGQGQGPRNDRKSIFKLDNEDQVTKETYNDRWQRRQDLNTGTNQIGQATFFSVLREVNPSSKRKWEGNHQGNDQEEEGIIQLNSDPSSCLVRRRFPSQEVPGYMGQATDQDIKDQ